MSVEFAGTERPSPEHPEFSFAYAVIRADEVIYGTLTTGNDVRVLLLLPGASSFDDFSETLPVGTRTIQFLTRSDVGGKPIYVNPSMAGFLLETDGVVRSTEEDNPLISTATNRTIESLTAVFKTAAGRIRTTDIPTKETQDPMEDFSPLDMNGDVDPGVTGWVGVQQ